VPAVFYKITEILSALIWNKTPFDNDQLNKAERLAAPFLLSPQ
jgi:hypothetical protein